MKILITGGAGFIGSHISRQLLEQGHEVVIYDNFSTSQNRPTVYGVEARIGNRLWSDGRTPIPHNDTNIDTDKRLTTIEASLSDSKKLVESLQRVDAVIHMASFISVEESVKNPLKYLENNVMGTASLLIAMREAGVKKIIFSSSATVYGTPKTLPLTEDAPISAANPYGATKIASEAICESFARTDGFDVTILRYFNPYGPGENHQPESHAIPIFIKTALSQGRGQEGLEEIEGKEPPSLEATAGRRGLEKKAIPLYWKGETVRDFIYVEDLAAAHIAVLELKGYQVFNVSTGQGTKIIDVVNKLSDILGYKVEIEDKGERAGDVMSTYASNAKLREATDWEAKTGLEEGLRKTVEWFKRNS